MLESAMPDNCSAIMNFCSAIIADRNTEPGSTIHAFKASVDLMRMGVPSSEISRVANCAGGLVLQVEELVKLRE